MSSAKNGGLPSWNASFLLEFYHISGVLHRFRCRPLFEGRPAVPALVPRANISGTTPRPKASDVIRIGRSRSRALVRYDRNHNSVPVSEVGRTVTVRAYADKIKIISQGKVIAFYDRQFGRGKTMFDPWHSLPVLQRKPGALRNGAPFQLALTRAITDPDPAAAKRAFDAMLQMKRSTSRQLKRRAVVDAKRHDREKYRCP